MDAICNNCRHFRQTEMRDRDGSIITVGYCHAIATFPYRTPDCTCKRYHYNEKLALK